MDLVEDLAASYAPRQYRGLLKASEHQSIRASEHQSIRASLTSEHPNCNTCGGGLLEAIRASEHQNTTAKTARTRQDKTRQDKARQGKATQDKAKQRKTTYGGSLLEDGEHLAAGLALLAHLGALVEDIRHEVLAVQTPQQLHLDLVLGLVRSGC
eukprot:676248-Rhodomonas_salina.1